MKHSKRLFLVFLAAVSLLLLASAVGGEIWICKVCYTEDFCLNVLDDFGYANCRPNVQKCVDVGTGGAPIYWCWEICTQSNPCLLPPQ